MNTTFTNCCQNSLLVRLSGSPKGYLGGVLALVLAVVGSGRDHIEKEKYRKRQAGGGRLKERDRERANIE